MIDPRWEELADILVHYSSQTAAGDKVLITLIEAETTPLLEAVYEKCIRAGAFPHVEYQSAKLERALLLWGNDKQLGWIPEPQVHGMEWADVYIGLRGAHNPHEFTGISSGRIALHKQAMGTISALRTQSTRWVLVRVPNQALAQQAHMSLSDMMSFFFRATLRDWKQESVYYQHLKNIFEAASAVQIVGQGTDLGFSTRGRQYVVEDGHINMPGGEIFTAPVDDSVEGSILFEFPGIYAGQMVRNIRLNFAAGQVVSASAETNESLLHEILEVDEGARRVGEFGVGTNSGMDRFCYEILYDEKIKGTVHLALGRAYSECGGTNYSTIHWDLIKDLRKQGQIYLDGKVVFDQGKFLI